MPETLPSAHMLLAAQLAVVLGRQLLPPPWPPSAVGDCLARRFLSACASDTKIQAMFPVAALQPAAPRAPPQPGSGSDSAAFLTPSSDNSPAAGTFKLLSFWLSCLNGLPGATLPSWPAQQAKRLQCPVQRSISQTAPTQFSSSPRPATQPVTSLDVEESSSAEQDSKPVRQQSRPVDDTAALLLSKLRLKLQQRDFEEVVRLFSESIAAEVSSSAAC